MRLPATVAVAMLIGGCCQSTPTSTVTSIAKPVSAQHPSDAEQSISPTVMSRVTGGYELKNKLCRVVISEQTGDVVYWGFAGQDRNMLFHRGIYATLSNLPDVPLKSTTESGDKINWGLTGEDANQIRWQKCYTLEQDVLTISVVVTNHRKEAVESAVQLNGDLPNLRIMHHDPEQFDAAGGFGLVSVRGSNQVHTAQSPPLPTILQSDSFVLKPGERRRYDSVWMLSQ